MTMLETTRFFEKQARVPCAVCGAENSGHQGGCFHCSAPLELSRSIVARGTSARFVPVVGASGAGKTVFLGLLLDILSKGYRGLQGVPNGSFSISVQHETVAALQSRRFPEKTASEADRWRWVHCEVVRNNRRSDCLDLVTPDLAGEAIALEMEQPGTFETIRVVVRKSAAMLVLIDSMRVRDAGRSEDLFAMKLISYLASEHPGGGGRRKKTRLPVALVFSKADLCPEAMRDPARFAAANVPGLVRLCECNLSRYRFFASGVVGASAVLADDHGEQIRIPLRIEPRGVVAPLEWLVEQL